MAHVAEQLTPATDAPSDPVIEMVGGFARYLFKYRRLTNDTDLLRIKDILDGRLWAASRQSFNDPFDCAPVIRVRRDPSLIQAHVKEVVNRQPGDRKKRRAHLKQAMKRTKTHGFEALARQTIGATLDGAGIVSLSEQPDSLLMWGHYGSEHTGVVIKIETDVRVDSFFKVAPFPVIYTPDRPVLWYPKYSAKDLLEASFLRKADLWSYEKEWRIIYRSGPGLLTLPRRQIVGVVFGARTTAAHQDAIRTHVAGRPGVRFYQAGLDPDQYRISISECRTPQGA